MNAISKGAIANVTKNTTVKLALNDYDIDVFERTIYFGKKFMKLAKQYGTPEYNIFLGLIHDLPDFKIVVREAKDSGTRMSTRGLTREFMERHIRKSHGENSAAYTEFKNQLAYSEGQINPYMYLRKWFVKEYPNWDGKQEQREEARRKRDEAKMRLVVITPEDRAKEAEKEAEAAVAEAMATDDQQ